MQGQPSVVPGSGTTAVRGQTLSVLQPTSMLPIYKIDSNHRTLPIATRLQILRISGRDRTLSQMQQHMLVRSRGHGCLLEIIGKGVKKENWHKKKIFTRCRLCKRRTRMTPFPIQQWGAFVSVLQCCLITSGLLKDQRNAQRGKRGRSPIWSGQRRLDQPAIVL